MRRVGRSALGWLVVGLCAGVSAALAGPTDADWNASAATRSLRAWVAACERQNAAALAQWQAAHRAPAALARRSAEERAQRDRQDCAQHGPLQVRRVSAPDAHSATLIAQAAHSGVLLELSLGLDPEGKVAYLGMAPAELEPSDLPPTLDDAALAQAARQSVQVLAQRDLFSGVLLVARGNQPLVVATAGQADRERGTGFTERTRFSLGSLSKLFTGVAVAQLVERGLLSYDDRVGRFFPDYPQATVRERVSVGMLLAHRSGLGDFLDRRPPDMMRRGLLRAEELLPLFERDAPAFEPGSEWSYSNAGLALAGAIVERVSGEAFPDYLRRHVFAPAGMTDSDPNFVPAPDEGLATPYSHQAGADAANGTSTVTATASWRTVPRDLGSPAGGAVSSARDLMRFATALRDGTLLKPPSLAHLIQARGTTPWGTAYGYATVVQNLLGSTLHGHGGGYHGVSTELYMVAASDLTVLALSNQDPNAAEWATQKARAWVAAAAAKGRATQ